MNLEVLVRQLEADFGSLDLLEYAPAAVWMLHWAHQVEHWWVAGAGAVWSPPGLNHNLSVYSYDINDACTRTLADIERAIVAPSLEWLRLKVNDDVDRTARRVLANGTGDLTLVGAAKVHGEQ